MIERLIYKALKEGITRLQNSPDVLEDMFVGLYGLSKTEFEAIRTVFKAKPPNVVHGYAHTDHQFPLFAITMGSETEALKFIGDDGGMIEEEGDPDYHADVITAVWQHNHDILVYTEHPDVTLYYYEIVKNIMLAAQPWFTEQGLFEIDFSGMDMAPDPRYVPENLFLRKFTMKSQREFQLLDNTVKRAFKISGIAIDSSGSPSDVGGVETNLTVYAATLKG